MARRGVRLLCALGAAVVWGTTMYGCSGSPATPHIDSTTTSSSTTTVSGGGSSSSSTTTTSTSGGGSSSSTTTTSTGGGGSSTTSTSTTIKSTTSTSTSTSTSTTSVSVVSFAATVWPQMNPPSPGTTCVSCHGGFTGPLASIRFTDEPSAFTFAVNRSISGNPNGSLFLEKPAQLNGVMHGGGQLWPPGSAGYNAAVSWINGGLNP